MHAIGLDSKISRVSVFASRAADDLVIFDERSGRYFSTGAVGAEIWDLISEPRTLREICAKLTEVFDVPHDVCVEETQAFVSELINMDLVVVD